MSGSDLVYPNIGFWPVVSVNFSVNMPNRNVGFAPESGRSECACCDRAVRLLMAESRHSLTVNMQAYA
jgi:hypothetical protein